MGKPKVKPNQLIIDVEFVEMISKLLRSFDGNCIKTKAWLVTPNLQFGYIAPLKLWMMGKGNKVLAFIENAWDESQPPEGFEVKDGKLEKKVEPREWSLPLNTLIVNSDFDRPNGIHVREVLS